jgi:hypothetical protein
MSMTFTTTTPTKERKELAFSVDAQGHPSTDTTSKMVIHNRAVTKAGHKYLTGYGWTCALCQKPFRTGEFVQALRDHYTVKPQARKDDRIVHNDCVDATVRTYATALATQPYSTPRADLIAKARAKVEPMTNARYRTLAYVMIEDRGDPFTSATGVLREGEAWRLILELLDAATVALPVEEATQ